MFPPLLRSARQSFMKHIVKTILLISLIARFAMSLDGMGQISGQGAIIRAAKHGYPVCPARRFSDKWSLRSGEGFGDAVPLRLADL